MDAYWAALHAMYFAGVNFTNHACTLRLLHGHIQHGIETDINGHRENRKKKTNHSLKKHIPYYTIHRSIHHKYIEGGWFYLNLLQLHKRGN